MKRIIFETPCKTYRIIEKPDNNFILDDLKGDIYNPEINKNIDKETLRHNERKFENKVFNYGVYGYILERWNSAPSIGYEHLDSCWGFVGQYQKGAEDFEHYIVKELMDQIPENFKPEEK